MSERHTHPFPDRDCGSTGSRLLHGGLRDQYEDMLVRMQGKRLVFAGDSLMDMVFYPFVCSADALGWNSSVVPVGEFGSRADSSAGTVAKMLTKKNHEPIVVAFMRFYNYNYGDANVKSGDPFHFRSHPRVSTSYSSAWLTVG